MIYNYIINYKIPKILSYLNLSLKFIYIKCKFWYRKIRKVFNIMLIFILSYLVIMNNLFAIVLCLYLKLIYVTDNMSTLF